MVKRREIHESLVEILDFHAELDDVVDRTGQFARVPLDLGRGLRELRRRDAPAVAPDPALELFLTLQRIDMRAPVLDHPLDKRPHSEKGGIRLLRGEVAHACNPMRR